MLAHIRTHLCQHVTHITHTSNNSLFPTDLKCLISYLQFQWTIGTIAVWIFFKKIIIKFWKKGVFINISDLTILFIFFPEKCTFLQPHRKVNSNATQFRSNWLFSYENILLFCSQFHEYKEVEHTATGKQICYY